MRLERFWKLVLASSLTMSLSSCLSKSVDVVPFLPPTHNASLPELVEHINRWRGVDSLVLGVELQFETVEEAEKGEGRQFRTADGRMLLERPQRIRLNIEAPILSASIAEMASDGERFQLLIHPADYRALIVGRNDASYREQAAKLEDDPELEKAGPLANIRPHHFTDAFLLPPVPTEDPHVAAFLTEERVEEADDRPRAKNNAMVRKSYYVVTAVRLGREAPRARYWFGRSGELALRRLQLYDVEGRLEADITYRDYLPPQGDGALRFASRVHIDRPYDDYAITIRVKADGIQINRDLPDRAFVITAPEEWGDSLRRIDLDERGASSP